MLTPIRKPKDIARKLTILFLPIRGENLPANVTVIAKHIPLNDATDPLANYNDPLNLFRHFLYMHLIKMHTFMA